jgi:hypothetical protein
MPKRPNMKSKHLLALFALCVLAPLSQATLAIGSDTMDSLKAQFESDSGWRVSVGAVPYDNLSCLKEQLQILKEAFAPISSQLPENMREINLEGQKRSGGYNDAQLTGKTRIQFSASVGEEENLTDQEWPYNDYGHLYVKYNESNAHNCFPVSLERAKKVAKDVAHRFGSENTTRNPSSAKPVLKSSPSSSSR